ncbi:SDR family oxidoreductase [Rhodococcus sp. NCIMB 12038]|uniref:SDR family oxidoreductase n=1 Tax=Rhodococcus sp. NCIMB 12038 TaxID=933800 RepID=UPI000B3C6346|nr:SDR family oxidoreductase [Rhodococcus sp. NCIMB 12038]OUS88550.1 short chain dehydrogenase [Rhodococcus sp. NCIMB 12038]
MNAQSDAGAGSHSFDLNGQVALVTGAASGIGRAIAIAIAEHGGHIAVVDLPTADAADTLAAVQAHGRKSVFIGADVTSPTQMGEAVARTQNELGPLTLAVNAAGIANAAPAESMSVEQWQRVYDVDVTGVFVSCQAEAQAMLDNGRGAIVNVGSMSGSIANRGLLQCHYNSAKAAVKHLSASLAMEWAQRGVRVNCLSPGYTATPMNTRPEMVDQMQVFADETPMGRIAAPAEMGGPAVFLLSDAASFVTGIDLLVDGGFCAR